MTSKTKITFLGLGAMGSRMASRLVSEDTELKVWSRSGLPPELTGLARHLVSDAASAAGDADIVIAMVTDDAASRAVWLESGALGRMKRGAIAIECSTLTPTWVHTLAERAANIRVGFVDAPVVGSRPQADAGTLIFLAGGDALALQAVHPTLLRMGSAVHHLGASPAGAVAKLLANAFFTTQVAALAELVAFARCAKVELTALARALDSLPLLSTSAKGALSGMLAEAFAPLFPLALAAKDLRYAVMEAAALDTDLPVTTAARHVFEQGINSGLSAENLTAVVKLHAP